MERDAMALYPVLQNTYLEFVYFVGYMLMNIEPVADIENCELTIFNWINLEV